MSALEKWLDFGRAANSAKTANPHALNNLGGSAEPAPAKADTELAKLAELAGGPKTQNTDKPASAGAKSGVDDAFEERCAIIEFEGGLSREEAERLAHVELAAVPAEWREGVGRLESMTAPCDYTAERWRHVIVDCHHVLEWAPQAIALGWGNLDLFGAHSRKPSARLDLAGLALSLHGGRIVMLEERSVTIETVSGVQQTCRRHNVRDTERCAVWELGT